MSHNEWLPNVILVSGLALVLQGTVRPVGAEQVPGDLSSDPAPAVEPGIVIHQPAKADGAMRMETKEQSKRNGAPRIALTLAGGGARGAAHVGVLKVLEAEGIKPDFVCGSSIGAIVGALYCAGISPAEIERLMLDGAVRKALIPVPMALQSMVSVPKYLVARLAWGRPRIAVYSGRSISKFINKQLPPSVTRIEEMKIPFAVIATNLVDTRPVWITKGDVGEAVRASASIPFMYKPVKIDGRWLLDGGIRSNLPTDPALAAGAPIVVAVRLHSTLETKAKRDFSGILSYSDRILSMMMAEIEQKNTADADVLIEPDISDCKLYSFHRDALEKCIVAGETAARKMLPALKAKMREEQLASAKQRPVRAASAKQRPVKAASAKQRPVKASSAKQRPVKMASSKKPAPVH